MKKRVRGRNLNVLLIGETGVGKSTFINAFVNYLAYQTLDEAEQNGIIAVLPASFLITTGHDFDEVTVNIGDPDPNEDFNERGASVTQHCRSYIIRLRSGLHLRLIDTPGMGDTRGIEQDMKNIDHILSYVDQFTHLDAVCFLLKPNTARMTIFFRFCLQQLLTYLTPQAYENIIFCFTNTRSTFYAPGDTGPLLRKVLDQNYQKAIPFEKKNTFCFDSESFRYLALRKRNLDCAIIDRDEFLRSWNKSVEESVRLLDFIVSRSPYRMDEWQSSRRTSLTILRLVRPLMEKLRLMIYNTILRRHEINDRQITARFTCVTMKLCSVCAVQVYPKVSEFYMRQYRPEKKNGSEGCICVDDGNRLIIEALVEYQSSPVQVSDAAEQLSTTTNDYLDECSQLCRFLFQNEQETRPDPFESLFGEFIREQQYVIQPTDDETDPGNKVLQMLITMQQKHKENMKRMKKSNETVSLDKANDLIKKMLQIPDVREHDACVRESRRQQLKAYERSLPMGLLKNKHFDKFH